MAALRVTLCQSAKITALLLVGVASVEVQESYCLRGLESWSASVELAASTPIGQVVAMARPASPKPALLHGISRAG